MCLAPRYIRGPIAAPVRPCRYTASLPDTPCANASAGRTTVIMTATARTVTTRTDNRFMVMSLLPLIAAVAAVTARIERLASGQDSLGILGGDRLQCQSGSINHRLRH